MTGQDRFMDTKGAMIQSPCHYSSLPSTVHILSLNLIVFALLHYSFKVMGVRTQFAAILGEDWLVTLELRSSPVPFKRPPPASRTFVSPAVEDAIVDLLVKFKNRMKDKELASIFENCLPNTLDTTVAHFNNSETHPDSFIITGDIPAMWQRDSSAQVTPYLHFVKQDPKLKLLIKGLILRQSRNIIIDPYANAFNYNPTGSPWAGDNRIPKMTPSVFEGKYELDSHAWHLRLTTQYIHATGDNSLCSHPDFVKGLGRLLDVVEYQTQSVLSMQRTDKDFYGFSRKASNALDTLIHFVGAPANTIGLSRSAFRPSDDAQTLPYSISNSAMSVVVMSDLVTIYRTGVCAGREPSLIRRVETLANQFKSAIDQYGIVNGPNNTKYFAFEIDGWGSTYFMDDANVPNLLSMPYFGFVDGNNPIYNATRARLLSSQNPYFFSGKAGKGIGSPHTGLGRIWPIGLIMQAMTSQDDQEIRSLLEALKISTAGTGFMHEAYDVNDPAQYSRSWFAWANSLFGEMILLLARTRPHLLF